MTIQLEITTKDIFQIFEDLRTNPQLYSTGFLEQILARTEAQNEANMRENEEFAQIFSDYLSAEIDESAFEEHDSMFAKGGKNEN